MDEVQLAVFDRVKAGKNAFFTGSAGVGKTFMLGKILDFLRLKHGNDFAKKVAVAATTGIAASHIDGVTLNSALGIGLPRLAKHFHERMGGIRKKKELIELEVLVVDEVSMLSAEMFWSFERELRVVRKNRLPAGGVQLIFCGDFFQLSPIENKSQSEATLATAGMQREFRNFGMAFECETWPACFQPGATYELDKVYRQDDEDFVQLLNRIRTGNDAAGAFKELIRDCSRPVACAEGIEPTIIYPRNSEIDRINTGIKNIKILCRCTFNPPTFIVRLIRFLI